MATLVYFRALHNTYGRNLKSPLNGQAAILAKDLQCFLDKGNILTKKTRVKTKSPAEKRGILNDTSNDFFPNNTRDGGSTTL